MTTNADQTANRLGALALRLSDVVEAAVAEAGGTSLSAVTALSALDRFLDQPTIGQLSEVIGLSSSATVRLVDALVSDGQLRRDARPEDGRQSTLLLTPKGRRTSRRIVDARTEVLDSALASLPPKERESLAGLLDQLLIGLVRTSGKGGWMCRLCDTQACGAEQGEPCAITKTALDR